MRSFVEEKGALAWAGCRKGNSTFFISSTNEITTQNDRKRPSGASAERHSFLQYAMLHFRDNPNRNESSINYGGSLRGTVRILEYFTGKKFKKGQNSDWTWKELTDKVKYSPFPIDTSLLKLDSEYLNGLAVDSFKAIMRYMGDLPLGMHQKEVECVYTILVICHHNPILQDELYCQLMKQTTNNKSLNQDSSIRGWRLLALMAAFFKCSDSLMPYLMKYLDTTAYDNRRLEQATAQICIDNLKQTIKYGGRRNVPTEQEVIDITEGKLNRQQVYFLPGGVQITLSTSASTVVENIIQSICQRMGIYSESENREFSLYCIVEGDQYTMPLENDEFILDLIAELERNENTYYLVFCRSVWNFKLRLDSELYIDIIFHQIVPDYLEGYLLVLNDMPNLSHDSFKELLHIATLLYRANGNTTKPTEAELVHFLPKTVLLIYAEKSEFNKKYLSITWNHVTPLNVTEAKAQCLELSKTLRPNMILVQDILGNTIRNRILQQKFYKDGHCLDLASLESRQMLEGNKEIELLLAINKTGANILDLETHETLWRFSFSAVNPPHNAIEFEGTNYADIMFGDLNIEKIIRLQVDHAHEVTRLIQQYEMIQEIRREVDNMELDYPAVMIKV